MRRGAKVLHLLSAHSPQRAASSMLRVMPSLQCQNFWRSFAGEG